MAPADRLLKQGLTPTPSLAVFHTRLGLAVVDAVGQVDYPEVPSLTENLIEQAFAFDDAYVARELLDHRSILTIIDARSMAGLINIMKAGSAWGRLPSVAQERLLQSIAASRAAIRRCASG